jgi:hypothetical protein
MLIAEASTLHVALPTWVVALLVALAVVFVLWATQDRRPREEE